MVDVRGIFVGRRAYNLCGTDLEARELEFLDSFNSFYYRDAATRLKRSYVRASTRQSKQIAAQTLRMLHGQALETLFANIFATLQAPHFSLGWLQLYRNDDLEWLMRCAGEGQSVDKVLLTVRPFTWEGISWALNGFVGRSKRQTEEMHRLYSVFWQSLAKDFQEPRYRMEYNGLKHGLRVLPGGFRLTIGKESVRGVPATNMSVLGSSDVGTRYQRTYRLDGAPNRSRVRGVRRTDINWDVGQMVHRLRLVSESLHNVNLARRAYLTGPVDGKVYSVSQRDLVAAQFNRSGVSYFDMDSTIQYNETLEPDPERLLHSYATSRVRLSSGRDTSVR